MGLAGLGGGSWELRGRTGGGTWKQCKYQRGWGLGRRGIYFWWVVIFFGVLLKMEKVIFVSTHGASSPSPQADPPNCQGKASPLEGYG